MFGGGGMNPRKMQQMMEQMGIDVTEIDAESVTITTNDGEQLVFDAPEITRMDAQGTQTYQIVGEPDQQEASGAAGAVESGDTDTADASDDADDEIPESDIKLVASQTGVSPSEAREALEAADGEPAAAISRLE
ncbi:nascent polypeptide-associated complex protein [Halonotius sp. F2-221B]|uniref:nascent polypeptide-associated complex protein n=1 Tax=Halonotius sp. F2-221B TaxID=2731620 RepID=UPI00398A65C3